MQKERNQVRWQADGTFFEFFVFWGYRASKLLLALVAGDDLQDVRVTCAQRYAQGLVAHSGTVVQPA